MSNSTPLERRLKRNYFILGLVIGIKDSIRLVINQLFELDKKGILPLDDHYDVVQGLDDILEKLNNQPNEKENISW